MAKSTVVYIQRPEERADYQKAIAGADDTDLTILGAISLMADGQGMLDISELEALERFDRADVLASVKYWRGAGILVGKSKHVSGVGTAHKGGAVTHTSVERYSNEELAQVLERRVGTAFVDEAQKVMGKIFNNGEVGKLVGIVDQLGFEEEAVLAILSYCTRLGKNSVSYAEKIAVSFHDEDISSAQDVHAKIDYLERRNSAIEKVRALFGFGGRALSATEKRLFEAWTQTYGFEMDVITRAYEITVDAIQSPAPKYTDKILTKWHENGLTSLSQIEAFEQEEKKSAPARQAAKKAGNAGAADAELDDWFDKVLQKSLGE